MSLPHKHPISLEEFYKRRAQHEQVCEYIDGIVYMSPSPSTAHQRIQGRLHVQLYHLLEEADCEVFLSPYDIELKKMASKGKRLLFLIYPSFATKMDWGKRGIPGFQL